MSLLVTAQDGFSETVYGWHVTRNASTESRLAELSLLGCVLSPAFDGDVFDYTCAAPRSAAAVLVAAVRPLDLDATVTATDATALQDLQVRPPARMHTP